MQKNDESRRSFLKQVLAGTTVATGVALTGKKAGAIKITAVQRSDEVLYSETEAFRKYYKSLR